MSRRDLFQGAGQGGLKNACKPLSIGLPDMRINFSEAQGFPKTVLNAGSGEGHPSDRPLFRNGGWEIVRLDIDPAV